jgi:hypothetical protein
MELDYLNDVQIDENALDVELLNQPKLALRYGQNWNAEEERLSLLEEQFSLLHAEYTNDVNADPEGTLGKGTRVTVDNVKSYCLQQSDYIELSKKVLNAKRSAKDAKIAYDQICKRMDALKVLVDLLKVNYFAGPEFPRDLSIETLKGKKDKSVNTSMATKLKRNK